MAVRVLTDSYKDRTVFDESLAALANLDTLRIHYGDDATVLSALLSADGIQEEEPVPTEAKVSVVSDAALVTQVASSESVSLPERRSVGSSTSSQSVMSDFAREPYRMRVDSLEYAALIHATTGLGDEKVLITECLRRDFGSLSACSPIESPSLFEIIRK